VDRLPASRNQARVPTWGQAVSNSRLRVEEKRLLEHPDQGMSAVATNRTEQPSRTERADRHRIPSFQRMTRWGKQRGRRYEGPLTAPVSRSGLAPAMVFCSLWTPPLRDWRGHASTKHVRGAKYRADVSSSRITSASALQRVVVGVYGEPITARRPNLGLESWLQGGGGPGAGVQGRGFKFKPPVGRGRVPPCLQQPLCTV
jgi:hypothetical protein